MTVILKLVILFSLYLLLPIGVRSEFCEVNGDLRRVKICSICIFRDTFQVCTGFNDLDLEWRHVCYREPWDLDLVDVYCRQNGYSGRADDFVPKSSVVSLGGGLDKLDNIECSGSESNLTECTYGMTDEECEYPLYKPYVDCDGEVQSPTVTTTMSTGVSTGSTAVTTESVVTAGSTAVTTESVVTTGSTAVTTESVVTTGSTAVTTESGVVTTGSTAVTTESVITTGSTPAITTSTPAITTSTPAITTSTPFNGRIRETVTTTFSERNGVTDSEPTSSPGNVRDILSPIATTPSASTNDIPYSSLPILLSILVASVICGSFIVVTTVAIACFICIFKLRNSHVKVNTPAVDYETPNLVFQNNFHLSTDSVVTSPIFESQLERIVTAYELPRMIPSSTADGIPRSRREPRVCSLLHRSTSLLHLITIVTEVELQ